MAASKRHVFLSWHDINFTVPIIKGAATDVNGRSNRMLLDIDDPRVSILTAHNNSLRVTGASVFDQISSPGAGRSSVDGSKFNLVNNSASDFSGSYKGPKMDDVYSQATA